MSSTSREDAKREDAHGGREDRCGSGGRSLSLPVLSSSVRGEAHPIPQGGSPIRKSRNAWKRAVVLGVIQVLIIAHVVQWWLMGTTVAPFEPSEAMETLKYGVVTVGFIFFALALASTAILGRWFCGWGCHVVMLQDLCGWLMKKMGVRPKPFRSRLLVYLPLGLALYMFAWPVVYRLAVAPFVQPDLTWPGWSIQLTTEDFWRTFPGVAVAVPFLFICGFACVYFLGAKGYCTYGCPYGGFFAPLDEVAPGRIRVTDACEHCGHCTAVCTSNVRVHEEVRDFGMVVDPGCMKCMDCVSVCPNDALYFGFGAPAVRKDAVRRSEGSVASAGTGPIEITPPAKASRAYDLSWPEELVLSTLAVGTLLAVRGAYDAVPLLFASGIAGCVTFLAWKGWRTLRDPNVRFHRWQLRLHGRLKPAGLAWVAGTAIALALVVHTGLVNASFALADRADRRVTIAAEYVFTPNALEAPPAMAEDARRAIGLYRQASFLGDGGIGLLPTWQPSIDLRIAWLQAVLRDLPAAEATLRRSVDRHGSTQAAEAGIARLLRAQGKLNEALAHYRTFVVSRPDWGDLRDEAVVWLEGEGDSVAAIEMARLGHQASPEDLRAMRRLSLILIERGDVAQVEEGIALVERTLEIAPNNPFAYRAMALGYGRLERFDEAVAAMRRAVELEPEDWRLRQALGELLIGIG
ncbi:MAG: 4Fe-4S dicluster domain-containing protein, partial [Phycisphaerales bacterium]